MNNRLVLLLIGGFIGFGAGRFFRGDEISDKLPMMIEATENDGVREDPLKRKAKKIEEPPLVVENEAREESAKVENATKQAFKGLLVDLFYSRMEFLDIVDTLSDREIVSLYHQLEEFNREFNTMERQHARIIEQTENQTVLEVEAFPDEGAEMKERLRAAMTGTLGEEKEKLVWRGIEDKLEDRYGFGQNRSKYTLSALDDGVFTLETVKEVMMPGKEQPTIMKSMSRFKEIPPRYRHLLIEEKGDL